MVNNNLVNAQEPTGTNAIDPAYSGEIISYAIIQKGAQSLTGTANLNYALQYNTSVNAVFVPTAYDSFANNLARTSTRKKAAPRDPLPVLTKGIDYTPNLSLKSKSMTGMLKELLTSEPAKMVMSSLGKMAMTALVCAKPEPRGDVVSYIDVSTTRSRYAQAYQSLIGTLPKTDETTRFLDSIRASLECLSHCDQNYMPAEEITRCFTNPGLDSDSDNDNCFDVRSLPTLASASANTAQPQTKRQQT